MEVLQHNPENQNHQAWSKSPFRGFSAIFYKESIHLRRDSMAIMFALLVPIVEMIILGAAIDTNVRQVNSSSGVAARK
ncbi:MAG: hypothetical protein DMG63_02225 [Acidobacteria bacterium]|nr:MAG: hypothetical protein DMG63_02225 [Acidobacteriota bacterium]